MNTLYLYMNEDITTYASAHVKFIINKVVYFIYMARAPLREEKNRERGTERYIEGEAEGCLQNGEYRLGIYLHYVKIAYCHMCYVIGYLLVYSYLCTLRICIFAKRVLANDYV